MATTVNAIRNDMLMSSGHPPLPVVRLVVAHRWALVLNITALPSRNLAVGLLKTLLTSSLVHVTD